MAGKEKINDIVDNNIVDISIPSIQKQRFRINGDSTKILELNTSDANVVTRLEKGYKKLLELANKVADLSDDTEEDSTEEALAKLSDKLGDLDKQMREQLDYIFDSNVSEVCVGNGSMYSPKDGQFYFEHIIESIGKLYENSFNQEFRLMKKRMEKHTSKYMGKK